MADIVPDAAAVETTVPGQTEVSGTPAPDAGTQTPEEAFFDATKVPQELQPSFREMQAAWTKKVQESKDRYGWVDEFGDPEEVQGFLSQFRDPEQTFNWWLGLAEELGVPTDRLLSLLNGEQEPQAPAAAPPANPEDDPYNRPVSVRELAQYFQHMEERQQTAAREAAEDRQLDDVIGKLGLPENPQLQRAILSIADALPKHLGMEERVKRALDVWRGEINAQVSAATKRTEENRASAPVGLGGSAPTGGEAPNNDWDVARERAKQRLASWSAD